MARRPAKKLPAAVAHAYIRMSTDDQTLSPEAQRAAIIEFCARKSIVVAAWYEDLGLSGGLDIDQRPGLMGCMNEMKAHGATMVVVAKRDRLARDTVVAGMVQRLVERVGGAVLSADGVGNGTGAEDELLRTIVNAFAQYERALIRSRTKSALAVKKAKGERVGQVPFGFKVDPIEPARLVPDDSEQSVIERIRAMSAAGASYPSIVHKLTEEGVSARGSRWHVTTVGRIVRREAA